MSCPVPPPRWVERVKTGLVVAAGASVIVALLVTAAVLAGRS